MLVGSAVTGQEQFEMDIRQHIRKFDAEEYIHIIPFQTDVQKIWQACDIAVVPSTEPEAFGLTALEAMASGKPVIGTNHGGMTDVIHDGETGFLIPPNAPDALASALEQLIDSFALRKSMGYAGKERAAITFNVKNYTRSFEHLYLSMSSQYE